MPRCCTRLLTMLLLAASAAAPARAQLRSDAELHLEHIDIPHWVNGRTLLGANLLLAGLSAGLLRELRGGQFLDGFAQGAAGGTIVFLGKHVSARQFDGAGLLGRQLVSLGSGVVRNGGAGLEPLALIELSLGPADLVWDTRAGRLRARLDPVGAAAFAVGAFNPRFRLDAAASLSAGTPVFRTHAGLVSAPWGDLESCGLEVAGVIFMSDFAELGPAVERRVLAHERLHAVQAETFQAYWGRPLLEWVLPDRDPWPRLLPFLDVNLGEALAGLTDTLFFARYGARPWEIEAEAIAIRHPRPSRL